MKALVVYGTRRGGTREVAERIGDTLREDKHLIEVADVKINPQVNSYDLVIIGSGIRADSWTKSALSFLEKNAKLLRCKKTALFVSCQMADREKEARDKAKVLARDIQEIWLETNCIWFFWWILRFQQESWSHSGHHSKSQ